MSKASKLTGAKRDAIAARLALLAKNGGGRLTPDAVIADAKNPKSPLHDQFEWDVGKAAYEHWQQQARDLIVSVKYTMTTTHTTVRVPMYYRDPTCAPQEAGYVDVPKLRSDEDMARDALIDAFRAVGDMLRRAQQLAVALEMDDEVAKLLNGVVELRQRLIDPPSQMM
jgi:hypothetical protein